VLLRKLLRDEFARRQNRNRRYSLRAFARDLRVHHSTLSRVMRGKQRVTAATLAGVAARLGVQMDPIKLAESDSAVLATVDREVFKPDSRWIAMATGLSVDVVNEALHRLLRTGKLFMESTAKWTANPSRGDDEG
jgi:transcriptional regulator with XRE-family HTH domain